MSSSDSEGNEDLEHVTLVRMEDVQPDKSTELYLDLEYDNECIIDDRDEDYAIESMVPIKWVEDISQDSDSARDPIKLESAEDNHDTPEYIIPDMMSVAKGSTKDTSNLSPSSWPTLEILPGGVIKDADKYNDALNAKNQDKSNEMMYACAKCPQKFKHLYCLVRHVRWHEGEKKQGETTAGKKETAAIKNRNTDTAAIKNRNTDLKGQESLLKPIRKEKKVPVVVKKASNVDKSTRIQKYKIYKNIHKTILS